jgi:hypothetical protein
MEQSYLTNIETVHHFIIWIIPFFLVSTVLTETPGIYKISFLCNGTANLGISKCISYLSHLTSLCIYHFTLTKLEIWRIFSGRLYVCFSVQFIPFWQMQDSQNFTWMWTRVAWMIDHKIVDDVYILPNFLDLLVEC